MALMRFGECAIDPEAILALGETAYMTRDGLMKVMVRVRYRDGREDSFDGPNADALRDYVRSLPEARAPLAQTR